MEFAPDGSLYIVDWHNILIGHMRVVLHVADKYVVPINNVERSVRGELHINGPVIAILGLNKVKLVPALESCSVIFKRVLFGAKKSDGVVDKEIALHIVRKMAARHKLQTRRRPDALCFFDQIDRFV